MPLCPQITNTPITVTLTGSFTVTNVVPVLAANTEQLAATDASVAAANAAAAAATTAAAAAAATAGAAQSTANTALANAATAYNAAIASLQPSANTIVNASNQMTAIAANGITVYSGASATSGPRVVLNSTGLAGFDSSGSGVASFSISASTGAAVFRGNITTGATITGGTMNIGGNAIIDSSGLLTATGATITGAINATSGYFGTVANGFSISSTGLVGVGSGTIVGGAISGTTFTNGSTFSVSSTGNLTATSGTIAGFTLSASTITNGSTMTLYNNGDFYTGGVVSSTGGLYSTAACSFGSTLNVTGTATLGATTHSGTMTYAGIATGSGSTMVVVTTGSRVAYTTSSERFKQDIQYISTTGWLDKVLSMKPITYKTHEDYVIEGEPNETQIGFLAEDIYDLGGGLEKTVVLDPLGEPFSLSYDRLTTFLVLAIKELKTEIETLKGE